MAKVDKSSQAALNTLAKRIREARKKVNLSQADLALGIGVSDKAVSAYEQGRSLPSIEKLQKIAEQTEHPLTYFTQDQATEAIIASKLTKIEHELAEIKHLLKRNNT